MITRRLRCLVAVATLAVAPNAHALSPVEQARLAQGDSVIENTVLLRNGQRFVGGVAYRIVDADADRLSRIFRTPAQWAVLLPRVSAVQLTKIDPNGMAHVRVTHAFGLFSGTYDIILAFTDQGRYGRFWIDQHGDNDLVDGWGFIRFTPLPAGRTLVTWAVLFDLGGGVTRALFEAKMQGAALDVPRRLAHAAAP
jgi:hypothetical protein